MVGLLSWRLALKLSWRLALKLDVTLLGNRGLLDGNHLALHVGQLGCCLFVTTDKKRRRPEDDDRRRGGDAVLCPLAVLSAGQRGSPCRDGLSLQGKLLAGV